jgi:hypothetical protein
MYLERAAVPNAAGPPLVDAHAAAHFQQAIRRGVRDVSPAVEFVYSVVATRTGSVADLMGSGA